MNTGTSTTYSARYHWVIGTDHDHCSVMAPLFAAGDGYWTTTIIGWVCLDCCEQVFE